VSQTIFIIVAIVLLLAFAIFVLLDRPKGKRFDDRDAKKADEIRENPALVEKSQQAAELQVGENRERVQPSRFEPDQNERIKYPQEPSRN
jgi:hypothetical protein